jgi:hypothetical protein
MSSNIIRMLYDCRSGARLELCWLPTTHWNSGAWAVRAEEAVQRLPPGTRAPRARNSAAIADFWTRRRPRVRQR